MSVSTGDVSTQTTSGVCSPGADGIPDGPLGRIICGDWHTEAWHTLLRHWPLVAAGGVGLLVARLAWALLRRRRWSIHAAGARWLEITPPVSATPAATVQLWRLLATLLAAPSRLAIRPPRLVWEVTATGERMRAGLWIPPGINPTAITRIVQRAWPGARTEQTPPPRFASKAVVAAHRLVVTQPEWLPLLDDPPPTSTGRGAQPRPEDDRLRAVFDGLAAAGRTGGALLQVHLSRAPRSRVATLRRATVNPHRAHRRANTRPARFVAGVVGFVVGGLLDLVTPHSSRHSHRGATAADPYATQLSVLARRKYADPPHLLATVYAAAAGPTKAAAQAAAADIGSGYGLVSAQFSRHRLHRAGTVVERRWAPVAGMSLVSVAEAAALAGLPAEPSAHGLPAAAARARLPHHDIWTPTTAAADPPPGGEPTVLPTIPEDDTR
jgi:hypothetical protein